MEGSSSNSDLISKIKKQVEFYFGDSNFPKDKFLRAEAAKNAEGYIPIATIASFTRMRALTTDVDLITQVMRSSDLLKVSDDGTQVKRLAPVPDVDTSLERSIYARGFPAGDESVTIEKVEEVFSNYGKVNLVRLRRTKDRAFKGSVFVEYATEDAAKAALAAKITYGDAEIQTQAKTAYLAGKAEKRKAQRNKNQDKKRKKDEAEGVEGEKGKEKNNEEEAENEEEAKTFTKGCVLRFKLEGEVQSDTNRWDIQTVIEPFGTIRFTEYTPGATDGYVRMDTPEDVQKVIEGLKEGKQVKGANIVVSLLEGEEEEAYWNRAFEAKKSTSRGRNKGGRGGRRGGRGRGRGGKRARKEE